MKKKRFSKIVSMLMVIAMLAGLLPTGFADVAEASEQYPTLPDAVVADADELYPGEKMKLFFPDVVEIPAGTYGDAVVEQDKLIAVFYKNTEHARFTGEEPYGEICMAVSTDNGESWEPISTPIVTKDKLLSWGVGTEEKPLEGRDPNLALLKDGTVILTFFTNHAAYDTAYNQTYILESTDGGNTWSENPVQIAGENIPYVGASKRGDVAIFEDGKVLFPLQAKKDDDKGTYVGAVYGERTAPNTWNFERATELCNTADVTAECETHATTCTGPHYVNEASFIATGGESGNEVYALVREMGFVYRSTDRGLTWTRIATENLQIGTLLNQPGLKMYYDAEGEAYLYATYSVPATIYGRPVYGKSIKLSDLSADKEDYGWNDTKAELIYRSPEGTSECADPSSVPLDIDDDGITDKMFVIYYDGAENYIGGTFVDVSGTEEVEQDTYIELNVKDFGVPSVRKFSNDQGTVISTATPSESLDGIAITGIYNFSETLGYNSRVIFGGSWSGIQITASYNGNLYVHYYDQDNPGKTNDATSEIYNPENLTITPLMVDGESLLERDIKIRVSFQYQNVSEDGTSADVLFGITVEDVYSTYMVFENMNTKYLKQYIGVHAAEASPITITEPSFGELEQLTMEDFGVPTEVKFENADHKVIKTITPDASLDGKMITGTYNFATTSGVNNVVFGSSWFGVWIMAYEAYLDVYFYGYDASAGGYCRINGTTITPAEVDGKSLLGRDLDIKMFFNFENPTSDGDVDVQCGIIINDTCTKTMTFGNVAASNFKQSIGITAPAGYPMTLKGEAAELTLEDFGIPKDMTFEGVDHKVIGTVTSDDSLDGKLISGTYRFAQPAGTSSIVFGSSWFGVNVMSQGDNLYVYYYDGVSNDGDLQYRQFSITPSEIDGKPLTGRDIKLQLYFKYGNVDAESNSADVQVVFIINGILVKNVIFDNVSIAGIGQKMGVTGGVGNPIVLRGNMEEITLADFGVSTIKKVENATGNVIKTATPDADLDGKMITGTYHFHHVSSGNKVVFGSSYFGLWVQPSGDNLYVYYYDEKGTTYTPFTIAPSEVDGKALPGRDLKMQVFFQYGEVIDNRADVLVGFIIEDIYVKTVVYKNVSVTYLKEQLGLHASANCPLRLITKYVVGDFDIDGAITDIDFEELRQAILSSAVDSKYDMNESGTVDVRDIVRLKKETVPYPELAGKYISILGHSIDSYEGVSNDITVNSTIGHNSCTYGSGKTWDLNEEDMWWSQVIRNTGMKMLVCNASSGSAVSYDSGENGEIKKGSEERAVQLHDDNGENEGITPDIIAVTLGVNDFRSGQGVGIFNEEVWNTICQGNDTDGYTYTPQGAYFAEHYAIMLHKIIQRYPNADVFVFNIFEANEVLMNANAGSLNAYNEMIDTIAAYFGVAVVDTYHNSGINKDNALDYTFDGLHPNALGMEKYANAFEIALQEKYEK